MSGERKPAPRDAGDEVRTYAQERFHGTFRRVVELPQNADADNVSARYENGCLLIRVGRREASKPRVTLRADLPGVPRENLDVKVHDNTLTIEADTRIDTPAEQRIRHAEVRAPRYARTFVLSPDLDTSRIDANLRDGVLT
ncbi:Hsp20/alpha crystallin family protein, partial [Burkholderia gladioli]|uniref:Hsp20/alpha crystallin family protein n=1 Tax=Burkholderia gladioli TaxID=28095 RepID=UPI0031333B71